MTNHHHPSPADQRVPTRAEIDALFDRELDPADRESLIRRARSSRELAAEIRATSDALRELRRPLPTPDFTEVVLRQAETQRAFMTRRHRRRVRAIRNGVGVAALFLLAGVAVLHRLAPGAFTLENEPTPVSDMADAVTEDVAESIARIEQIAGNIPAREPAPRATSPLRLEMPEARELTAFAQAARPEQRDLTMTLASSAGDVGLAQADAAATYVFSPIDASHPLTAAMYRPIGVLAGMGTGPGTLGFTAPAAAGPFEHADIAGLADVARYPVLRLDLILNPGPLGTAGQTPLPEQVITTTPE